MPRDGSNIYNLPFPAVVSGTTISSGVYNGFTNDMALEQNNPRPLLSGGTGATSADAALFNLTAAKAAQLVTNYDAHLWIPGTFYSATTATGEPVDGRAFSGIAYINEALANPPTNQNVTLEARDVTDGKLYIRRKIAGSWGSWTLDGDLSGVSGSIALKADIASPTFTGDPKAPTPAPGDNDTSIATTAFVTAADNLKANLASPVFTGNPTAPNPPGGDNDASIATTAFITTVAVRYDMTQSLTAGQRTQARANISAPLKGHLYGLTLSTGGGSIIFGIAAGEAADSTGVDIMALSSAYTKTTAAWALGSGNGALDTGTATANNWYYVFLIKRPDTGVVDVLISLSPTAPTLTGSLAPYTIFRRIGAMKTNASSVWIKFYQTGDTFLWDSPALDLNAGGSPGTTGAFITLSIPNNIMVEAIFHASLSASSVPSTLLIHSPLLPNQLAGSPVSNFQIVTQLANIASPTSTMHLPTNNGTLRTASSVGGTMQVYINTVGYVDTRGKDG